MTDKLRRKGVAANEIARKTILRGARNSGAGLRFPFAGISAGAALGAVDRPAARGHSEHDRLFDDVDGRWLCWFARTRAANLIACADCDGGDRAGHASAVDHVAAALAAVVSRVLHQRRAHVQRLRRRGSFPFSRGRRLRLPGWPLGFLLFSDWATKNPGERRSLLALRAWESRFTIFRCGWTRGRCSFSRSTTTGTPAPIFFWRASAFCW